MDYEINKEIADSLMKLKGEVRGVAFKTDESFILNRKGEEGIKQVEQKIKELGQSLEFRKVESLDFYPIGLRVISLLVAANLFKFNKEDIVEMGSAAPKVSLIMKFFFQYFLSLSRTFSQVGSMWEKHYTSGHLSPEVLDEERKFISLELEGADFHPVMCDYLLGYFTRVIEMIIKGKSESEESECTFKGGKVHRFTFRW